MSDHPEFQFALEMTRQMVTLASALLVVIVTFAKDRLVPPGRAGPVVVVIGVTLLTLSIGSGLLAMGGMTGEIARPQDGKSPDVFGAGISRMASMQLVTLALSAICLCLLGCLWMLQHWRSDNAEEAPGGN